MWKSCPPSVLVYVWHQEFLVTLDLQEIRVLFPQDQGGLDYRYLSPNLSPTVLCWQQVVLRYISHRSMRTHKHKMQQMLFQDNLPNNHLHRFNNSSRSNRLRSLEPLVLVSVIRGILLDAALVATHRGLLHGQVLLVPVAVDGLSPLQDMEPFLPLRRRLQRPLLGPLLRALNRMQPRRQKRRSMSTFRLLTYLVVRLL